MPTPRGNALVQIMVDSHNVDRMIQRVQQRTSPAGVAVWLDTQANDIITTRARTRFKYEGDDVVGNWLPLKPFTQTARANAGYGPDHPINIRTGELMDYVVNTAGSTTLTPYGARLETPDPSSATDPTLVKKIQTAQLGATRPFTEPRPIMGLNGNDMVLLLLSLSKFVGH